jgi:valyl-tRNA synthetase
MVQSVKTTVGPRKSGTRGRHDEFLENLLGMDRYEAREAIVEWFRQNDLLELR